MAELAMIAIVTSVMAAQASGLGRNAQQLGTAIERAQGPVPIPGHSSSAFHVDPDTREVPVDLPIIEPRQDEPPSLPWDDVQNEMLFAQGDRYIELNVPDIYIPKQEVPTEPEKVQRDPLYPDDVKAMDHSRSRFQKVLTDPSNRNYAFDGYHIPYSVQNATHQEVSQSTSLAGRRASEYTSGGVHSNPAMPNIKNPTATTVRRQDNVWGSDLADDRSVYQTWDKRQAGELVGQIIQPALPRDAAYNNPTEWVQTTRVRAYPKYINPYEHLHGYRRLSARDQRGEVASYDSLKMKRLLLMGDEGFRSSQVTFYGGYEHGLKYPTTGRRREIMPAVTNPGLFQGGTGFSFRDENRGNPNAESDRTSSELRTRDVIVPNMWEIKEFEGIGRSLQEHTEPPFRMGHNQNPTVDFVKPNVVHPAYYGKAEPTFWSDNVSIDHPLHR